MSPERKLVPQRLTGFPVSEFGLAVSNLIAVDDLLAFSLANDSPL
jgi:hypothetical protein